MTLSPIEIEQWSRQIILPKWSASRLLTLRAADVAVSEELAGAALYFAASGVSNLTLYGENSETLNWYARRVQALNPACKISVLNDSKVDISKFDCVVESSSCSTLEQACLKILGFLQNLRDK